MAPWGDRAVVPAVLAALLLLPGVLGQSTAEEYSGFVVAGRRFSLLVAPSTGYVQGMGDNTYGQLGVPNETDGEPPRQVNRPMRVGLPDAWIVGAAAGRFHSLFVENGTGRAWATGWNRWGGFGAPAEDGAYEREDLPVQVAVNVSAVAAGYGHSLFLMQDGTVEAAGLNNVGQLGDGTTVSSSVRQVVALPDPDLAVMQVAAGHDFSYFLKENGDVYAVGQNLGGQLGDNTYVSKSTPARVDLSAMGGSQVVGVAASESHALFLTADGRVYGTGSNAAGQIGDEPNTPRGRPELSHFGIGTGVFAGGDSSCVIRTSQGQLSCAGSNLDGQLGMSPVGLVGSPTNVGDMLVYRAAIGYSHSLAISVDYSEVLVTGSNANGELGDGSNANRDEFFPLEDLDFTGTTTGAPTPVPTPKPTPAPPAPTPAPTPEPSRDGAATTAAPAPAEPWDAVTWMLVGLGAAAVGLVCCLAIRRTSLAGEQEEEEDAGDLELVRAGISMS